MALVRIPTSPEEAAAENRAIQAMDSRIGSGVSVPRVRIEEAEDL